MKLLVVFLTILAVAASCFKHAQKATNPCLFLQKCSKKQQVTCQDKKVHKPIKMKWPKVLPESWAKLLEAPEVQTVMPDITHCVELKRLLKNYKTIEMKLPNELPIKSVKLMEACRSYDVVPDIDLKSLPEKYLDNHRDKNDKATEIGSRNVQPLSSAKLAEVSRSDAVVPDINLKRWSEKYLDNHRDKNDKDSEKKSPNAVPVIPSKLLQILRSHAAVSDCLPCINLTRKQKEQLDDNGNLKLPLRSYPVMLELMPCDDLSQRQKEYLDYEGELKQDNSIETPAADISPETSKDYINDDEPDFSPFEDLTRKRQKHFDDKEDLDIYRKHGRSRKLLS